MTNLLEIAIRAANVPGWMRVRDLWLLAFLSARTSGRALEIGSWGGRSTRAILDAFVGESLSAVDPFKVSFDPKFLNVNNISGFHGLTDDLRLKIVEEKSARPLFDSIMSKSPQINKLKVYQESSQEYAKRGEIDHNFIFIDGDHSTDGFKHDIELALGSISSNGIIAGHDYTIYHPEIFAVLDGVKRLSRRFILTLHKSDIFIFLPVNCSWTSELTTAYDKIDAKLDAMGIIGV